RAYEASLGREQARAAPPTGGLACPKCGRYNAVVTRGYCIYCGAGIGPRPRPITWEVGSTKPDSAYTIAVHAGCGALAGAMIGAYVMYRIAWRTYLHAPQVALIIAIPAVILGVLCGIYRDRLWGMR